MARFFTLAMFLVVGVPLAAIGVLFALNMIGQTHEARFVSPSGKRVLLVRDDCRFFDCVAIATLTYEIDGRKAEMGCRPLWKGTQRFVFEGAPSLAWNSDETAIEWREDDSAGHDGSRASGTLDLYMDCEHKQQHVEKGRTPNFRLVENCLRTPCRREMVLWYSGDEYLFIPCPVAHPAPRLLFSTGNDHESNVEVSFDPATSTAAWKSLSTGETGTVNVKSGCDEGRKWREAPPPG